MAYVAITRAKRELYVLHTRTRLLYGQTMYNPVSRFISEIPSSLVEKPEETEGRPIFGRSTYGGYGSTYGPRGAEASVSQKRVYISETSGGNKTNYPAPQRTTIGKPLVAPRPQANREVFAAGDRVRHMTFGEGEVISVKPMGADTLYEIVFDRVGTKKLMATYAKLKKI